MTFPFVSTYLPLFDVSHDDQIEGRKIRFLQLAAVALVLVSPVTMGKVKEPDPRELIGHEFVNSYFPNGWKRFGDVLYDKNYDVSVQTVEKQGVYGLIFETTVEIIDRAKNSRRWKVTDAIRLNAKPGGFRGYEITRQCIGPSVKAAAGVEDQSQVVFAEVRFNYCQRYSNRIYKAWLIDMATKKISPVSPNGMRCEDTFFNNGPDGPTCPSIAKEW